MATQRTGRVSPRLRALSFDREQTIRLPRHRLAQRLRGRVDKVLEGQPLELAPADLEATFGLTGGNIMQGVMSLSSLAFMRPLPGYADYRTPVRGLYLCGAATHPGGGVIGACGYNAAREILKDG